MVSRSNRAGFHCSAWLHADSLVTRGKGSLPGATSRYAVDRRPNVTISQRRRIRCVALREPINPAPPITSRRWGVLGWCGRMGSWGAIVNAGDVSKGYAKKWHPALEGPGWVDSGLRYVHGIGPGADRLHGENARRLGCALRSPGMGVMRRRVGLHCVQPALAATTAAQEGLMRWPRDAQAMPRRRHQEEYPDPV